MSEINNVTLNLHSRTELLHYRTQPYTPARKPGGGLHLFINSRPTLSKNCKNVFDDDTRTL